MYDGGVWKADIMDDTNKLCVTFFVLTNLPVAAICSYSYSMVVFIDNVKSLIKAHQIPKLKCFSTRLAVVFAQSIEARS